MLPPIENVLSRFNGVHRAGMGFKARCPAHADRSPSLSIREGEDGRVLLHCFAGCEVDSVLTAMGLQMADLFPSSTKTGTQKPRLHGVGVRELQAAAEFEKLVLFIVKADQAAGRSVSQSDWDRAKLALERITLARRIL
jgi:hypothetical protein